MKALFSFNTFQNSTLVAREYYKLLKQTGILVRNKLHEVCMRKKKRILEFQTNELQHLHATGFSYW